MDSIMSDGGPLICMQDKWKTVWGGIYRLSGECAGARTDYDRMDHCNDWLNVVPVGASHGLVFGGEGPLETSIGRTASGALVIVQYFYAEPDSDHSALLMNLDDAIFLEPAVSVEFSFDTPDLVLFDSASPGDEIDDGRLAFKLDPGTYTVSSKSIELDAETCVLLHKFALKNAGYLG